MSFEFTDSYLRNSNDFYVEPSWSIRALIRALDWKGQIHYPACGSGTTPQAFEKEGFKASGNDIVYRGYPNRAEGAALENISFFKDSRVYDNIVTNPPYRLSEQFIHQGFKSAKFRIAILARVAFLNGQKRNQLYTTKPPEAIVILSRRPSMPPGGLGIIAEGGKTDYCWIVWNNQLQVERGQTRMIWEL